MSGGSVALTQELETAICQAELHTSMVKKLCTGPKLVKRDAGMQPGRAPKS